MASAGRGRRGREEEADHWPGFVDVLATLLLVAIFLLSLFAVAQYVSGFALSERDEKVRSLEAELSKLANALALAERDSQEAERRISLLQATLGEKDSEIAGLRGELENAQARVIAITTDLEGAQALSSEQQDQLALLNAQIAELRQQLATLNAALEAAEAKDVESQAQIENLSQRLNQALAQKLQEIARFRSRFFEELAEALGDRQDIKVVGDRFVFETDVLFASGSATLQPGASVELDKIAAVIREVAADIPEDIEWIIRVDGHTDFVPIATAEFPSNWELSTARAISVVKYFEGQGIPSRRLVAAGFADNYPLVQGRSASALESNRRIELKLDAR